MDSLLLEWIPTLATITTVAIVIFFEQYRSKLRFRTFSRSNSEKATNSEKCDDANIEELKTLKQLYYQLHNLEKFPEVLPKAKNILLSLLKETSAAAQALPEHENILSIQAFSRLDLEEFLRRRNNNIGKKWEQYNSRRKEGGSRELFEDREEAIWWLKQIAPVKYVDGAWLGHIGKVTTPFELRKTMKGAWQILSEELGDGDLEKNHVHVYHKLLETVAPGFPSAEVLDFGHPRHRLDSTSVWKAAIAQLIVSLFPAQFLPEILGFNLHYEAISMDTLKAGKELKEVGIDPYYFILHISIDNASSGHSAIAIEVVCEYMDYIFRVEGEKAAQKAWEKLQAGYLLSLGLPGTTVGPSRKRPIDGSDIPLSPTEMEVIRIFKAKAEVVHGIHCSSRVKIGSRSVADWLDPVALESKKWQMGLLDALSCSKYWICRGDSSKSRFIQELRWNGRMFGAFTQNEYDTLRRWVDGLPSTSLALECFNAGENIDSDDILSGYPVFQPAYNANFLETSFSSLSATTLFPFQSLPSLAIGSSPIVECFLPLWLTHPCLLQGFVSVPFRTKSKLACTIIKILRAQGGFDIEQECVAGMCEVRRPDSLGLTEIGMTIMAQNGISRAALPSLKHVLHVWPSKFAIHMLHLSMRPLEYKGSLIGMATAFAKMHSEIAKSRLPLLSAQDQDTLQKVAVRELEGLDLCWKEIKPDEKLYPECCKGYLVARHEIEKCFQN
ncbi:hypothetical protein NA56DRAFT_720357 [Hyaloscypha hepaticicola]|uniref:Uncharacterized protein n=1 Tax=Hyaloscypha hepaticicola TaxID=2082293 RepID=A0A2J6Q529_9HELO|nr:hypothetical protein NA56DRAFT_720357 [Hyaloscypha hepaticicola]